MKTYLFVLAFSSLLVLTASAQDNRKLRKDHTYSTHNYKHPNKSTAARQWEKPSGVVVQTPGLSTGPLANYKHPVPGAASMGGVVVPHTPDMDVAVRNYKIQRVSVSKPTPQTDSVVADRVLRQSVNSGQ
ncbi:hypothetical protein [Spirosoma pollinicola]|uniref:Uncharacterized protein n=1 Tax=Spirosoma pollinicola TaxID=2057025 RepID=A0A2K8Z2Y7_9BACT|nr:hypothetical protein [Spirosoma pollinicola]AUD04237.1 hypothetical protein CWM47_21775 [Spirosoma pollinicola]